MKQIFFIFFVSVLLATSLLADELPATENTATGEFFNKDDEPKDYYILTYASANQETIAQSQQLLQKRFGERIEYYVPEHHYIVYATELELQTLHNNGIVTDFIPYEFIPTLTEEEGVQDILILVFKTADATAIAERVKTIGGEVSGIYDTVIEVTLDVAKLNDLDIRGIEGIEAKLPVELFNRGSNLVSGITETRGYLGLYGNGQVIAVYDSGLDTGQIGNLHADLDGRVISLTEIYSGPPGTGDNCVDYNSHGTHVAGIALGNGILSGSSPSKQQYEMSYAGAAPEAQLVMQCMGGGQGQWGFPAVGIPYPWMLAQQNGAFIHSNSWGVQLPTGAYNSGSQGLDDYTWNNKEFSVVFAAGNSLGQGTVTPPSTAVNSISVSGHWRDDPNQRAGAEGPTQDGRFKPDIIAPSHGNPLANPLVNIISTMSSQQIISQGCLYGQQYGNVYCENGGTSMAAPRVSGALALIREYYQARQGQQNPSAALLKATLLNGGEEINTVPIPSFQNGWGRMNLSKSLPEHQYNFAFIDEQTGLTTGKKDTYSFVAGNEEPFVLTLAWTSPPPTGSCAPNWYCGQTQKKLVNDLNLRVIDPKGTVYNGNDIVAPYNDQVDDRNNVEQVRIPNPLKGKYTIEVTGFNLPVGSQDYAFALRYDNGLVDLRPTSTRTVCRLPSGASC